MPALAVESVEGLLKTGASARLEADPNPRFRVGERVLVRNINPPTHTRLPRYVRGKVGIVERDQGVFSFNDDNAHGLGHKPQHVYNVRFTMRALWGQQGAESDSLYLDLFDDYLDAASS
jgi:nitrile hydratase